jgi:hypothetical protein
VDTKEIESWKGFEYALRRQYAEPFNKMLKECLQNEKYAAASKTQGPQRSTESFFMAFRVGGLLDHSYIHSLVIFVHLSDLDSSYKCNPYWTTPT